MCHAVTGLDSSVCQGVSRGVFPRPETKLLDVFSQIMKAFVSSSLGNCSGLSGNAPFKRGETAAWIWMLYLDDFNASRSIKRR